MNLPTPGLRILGSRRARGSSDGSSRIAMIRVTTWKDLVLVSDGVGFLSLAKERR